MRNYFNISSIFFTLLRKILFLWVKTEVKGLEEDSLQLDPNKPVCYVLQYRSLSARLVLEQACLKSPLPSSQSALTIGERKVRRSVVFLYEPQGNFFKKRQSPTVSSRLKQIFHDVSEQTGEDTENLLDVQLIPVSLFWGRSPEKEKSWLKLLLSDGWSVPSNLKQLFIILLHGRRTLIQFNQALSVQQIYQESKHDAERSARKTARILRVHFRRVRQTVLGPNLSHRHNLVQGIINSPEVKASIEKHIKETDIKPEKAKQLALKYADEIASNLQISTIHFLEKMLNKLWNKIYNGIKRNNLNTVREVTKDHAVIYAPCHRSHVDYLLLSSMLFEEGIMVPHIAAGINLNLPVVGPILRRGGAFFMRRSFKGNQLYATVFSEYIHTIFKRGFSVEYFIEGGRSRTGRMLNPRAGMIAMTVSSYLRDQQKPIAFIPVYFGYEKVLEGSSYQGELRGKEKQKESVFGLFKSLKNLRNSFGKVSVNFGDPIYLEQFLNTHQPDWKKDIEHIDTKPEWLNEFVEKLALELTTRINSSAALNPVNMTALALLSTERHAMDAQVLAKVMTVFSDLLKEFPYSDTMTFAEGTGEEWIQHAEDMRLVKRQKQALGDIISLDDRNAVSLTYNRNNILHLFAVPSLIASLLRQNSSMEKSRMHSIFRSIYPYIRSELFLKWDGDEIDPIFEGWLKVLTDNELMKQEGDLIVRPAAGSSQFVYLTILSRFIIPTLQRYYTVVAILIQNGSGKLDAEELEKHSTSMAERMSILFGLNAPEFFDKTLFRNFIGELQEKDFLTLNSSNKLVYGDDVTQVVEDARFVLDAELRQSILQVTSMNNDG
ncbi:MAG: glycerol-3-phosphate O-acyltransferase [Oleiphilaceae bacterium]|jgi:glycerol-3-phosphate O-acyltransferase